MALTPSVTNIASLSSGLLVSFNLTPSGNYTTGVGGDTVDFSKIVQDPAFLGMALYIDSSQPPQNFDVWDSGGNLANGVFPVQGTTFNNSKVKFTSAFNTELGSGAYPAAITGSKLQGQALFPKQI